MKLKVSWKLDPECVKHNDRKEFIFDSDDYVEEWESLNEYEKAELINAAARRQYIDEECFVVLDSNFIEKVAK